MIPILLCADDYGLSPGIGRGIRALAEAGRLSATSCMALSPFWPDEARALLPFKGRLQVGLHLTLTDHRPLGPMPALAPGGRLPPLGQLLQRALRGQIDRAEVAAEFARQFEAFQAAWGGPPEFLDGHQHIHVLPGVREAVLSLARRAGGWVRCCHEPPRRILTRRVAPARAAVISTLGLPMRHALDQAGTRRNDGFSGVYDFSGRVPYGRLFQRFLHGAPAGGLIMCHPGEVDDALRALDPLVEQRETELRWFLSDEFATTLERHGRRLG